MAYRPTAQELEDAGRLARGIPENALASALSVGTARAAAQNQTLGNLRSRTAALLPTSALSVSFATSVGLLANDPSKGGARIPDPIAFALLACVVLIGLVTVVVQWPVKWSFDSGTNVYKVEGDDASPALRAAIEKLETVVARNTRRLRRTFFWFEAGVVLLGIETIIVVIGLVIART